MDEWRSQFPGVVITRTDQGDRNYAQQFSGDARKLLYELKNLMKFRNLGQLKMTRLFMDGTVITAWSIFGHDFVNIDVSRVQLTEAIEGTCTITLIDIVLAVPPMKDPSSGFLGGIWTAPVGNVSGVDYIKTYYSFDVSKCPTCQDIAWDFLFTYATPIEARHYFNPITNLDEPDNHTVYSLSPPAWAELISHGSDDGGNYIIWKAYTETDEYSRTGLGIMLLKAVISDDTNKIICSQEQKIDVDCCLKVADLRLVEIWWEDFGTCQPFIQYAGVSYNGICKMPTSVPIFGTSGLKWYGCTYPQQPLYAIPEINGSCLPVEWTLTGAISLWGSKKNDNSIFFKCNDPIGCNDEATITLRDRCGTEYIVRGRPCCEDAVALSISYTSLLMSCGGQQTFTSIGGCDPYVWAVTSGGGSITQGGVYTAPATNANCTDNPTITLTDCCGSSAQVQLAVNCYTEAWNALSYIVFEECEGCYCSDRGCDQGVANCWNRHFKNWRCDGVISQDCDLAPCGSRQYSPCDGNLSGYVQVSCSNYETDCSYIGDCGCTPSGNLQCLCDTLEDMRTQAMKEAGCCPLNPLTGFPY